MDNQTAKNNPLRHCFEQPIGGQKQRNARGNWEQATNRQQRKLVKAYDQWSAKIRKQLSSAQKRGAGIPEQYGLFKESLADLESTMKRITNQGIVSAAAISAGSRANLPAIVNLADKRITENEAAVAGGLIPTIENKLAPIVAQGLEPKLLREGFNTMRSAPAQYAGGYWVMIFDTQKELGQIREGERRSEGLPPEPVRWVLDANAHHCSESAGMHGCIDLEGEYDSWNALPTVPAGMVTCRGNCRCHIEVYRDGRWQRGVYED